MNKLKVCMILLLIVPMMSGCSKKNDLSLNQESIEYGSDIEKIELFSYKGKALKPKLSININSKEVGTYIVMATYEKDNITKDIKVVDNEVPLIELNQSKNEVFEIPVSYEYDLKGNIKKISDKVDGKIKNIDVVSKDEYDKDKSDADENKAKINKRYFKTQDDLDKIKDEKREKSQYAIVSSQIDTEKVGEYEVNILAVDYNFNTTECVYKVKVVDAKEVDSKKLASGAMKTSGDSNKKASGNSTVKVGKTDNPSSVSTSNKIAKAALARVGQSFWCDELCSQALVDAGVLTGDKNHFPGGFLALSTYDSIGKKISKNQLESGDIIYYNNAGSGKKHVAVYVGNNKAVHGGFNGKVVLASVNVGAGPTRYLRMPDHFTWDEAYKMVFGYNPYVGEKPSNVGGANPNIDYYIERTATKDGQSFLIKGKNVDTDAVDSVIDQFLDGKFNSDTFVSKLKGLGCTVDVSGQVIPQDTWYERKFSTDQGNYVIRGINVSNKTQEALDEVMLDFMFDDIDEATFISKVKALGCTVTKN